MSKMVFFLGFEVSFDVGYDKDDEMWVLMGIKWVNKKTMGNR